MKTYVTLERFGVDGSRRERRRQLSRSYTYDFIKALYCRFAQTSYHMGLGASLLQMWSNAGGTPYTTWGHGALYGILIGTSSTAPTVYDGHLLAPIGHGSSTGAVPQFTNPGFETGTLAGWSNSGFSVIDVASNYFIGAGGIYCARQAGSGTFWIQQSLDLTNVTAIGFGFRGYLGATATYSLSLLIDGGTVWSTSLSSTSIIEGFTSIPISGYSGVRPVRLQHYSNSGTAETRLDNCVVFGSQLEFAASEVLPPTYAATGDLVLRRYFLNSSGGSITVNEVGIMAYPRLIARDVIGGGVTVLNGETLLVTYTMRITP